MKERKSQEKKSWKKVTVLVGKSHRKKVSFIFQLSSESLGLGLGTPNTCTFISASVKETLSLGLMMK